MHTSLGWYELDLGALMSERQVGMWMNIQLFGPQVIGMQTCLLYASPMWHMGPGPIMHMGQGQICSVGPDLFNTYCCFLQIIICT